jgi:DNA-binding NarL/FixJ family response regulator
VLVAVSSQQVREALVAMIGALEGFRVVAEATSADQALHLARTLLPALAVVDEDFVDCGSSWTIQRLCEERLAEAVVAIGWRANGAYRARAAGADLYLEMGGSPDDVLHALRNACPARSLPQAQLDHLTDTDSVGLEPA